jgi:phosphonate transport system substrate-binding protein
VSFTHPIDRVMTTKYRQPLMDYLTANTPYRFRALLRDDSEKTVGMLEQRLADIVDLGVVSYLEAHGQFGAVPLVRPLNRDGEPYSRSVIVTRRGSTLRRLADLRGRSLALGSFHSTLSNLIPRHELIQAGVEPETLEAIEHFANDEEVITAVLEGHFDAGAVEDVVAYRHEEEGLDILHVSSPVPSAPLVVHPEIPARVVAAIRHALLRLDVQGADERQQWDEQIRYGFAPAADADYEPIRRIIATTSTGCAQACHGSP